MRHTLIALLLLLPGLCLADRVHVRNLTPTKQRRSIRVVIPPGPAVYRYTGHLAGGQLLRVRVDGVFITPLVDGDHYSFNMAWLPGEEHQVVDVRRFAAPQPTAPHILNVAYLRHAWGAGVATCTVEIPTP